MGRMLTVGSLFSGIGGLDLGLERAGMRVVWQCESDPYARAVLRKHWPGVHCYEDVRTLRAAPAVDLVCGGFPCQDISIAGKRAGIDGERSGLWREFARILGELRPRYALMENSPALTHGGLGRVLGDLAEIGMHAEWDCLPAAVFGAPHLRDRIFIVAHADRHRGRLQPEPESRRGEATNADYNRAQGPVAHDGGTRRKSRRRSSRKEEASQAAADMDGLRELQQGRRIFDQRRRPVHSPWWSAEPDVGRVVHGLPSRVDRIACLGNAVVPQVAEYIGRLIVAFHEKQNG